MTDKKLKLAFFTVPEYEREQEWLMAQHRAGWKLVGTTPPCFYHFEKCEPEAVVYQLDYNKDGQSHHQEYLQLFADCGWEHITDMVGYSYFRKPESQMVEREEIFCDDDSRMDMIKRVFRGKIVPLLIILCAIIIPQLAIQIAAQRTPFNVFLLCAYGTLLVLYLILFFQFATQYWRLKQRLGQ